MGKCARSCLLWMGCIATSPGSGNDCIAGGATGANCNTPGNNCCVICCSGRSWYNRCIRCSAFPCHTCWHFAVDPDYPGNSHAAGFTHSAGANRHGTSGTCTSAGCSCSSTNSSSSSSCSTNTVTNRTEGYNCSSSSGPGDTGTRNAANCATCSGCSSAREMEQHDRRCGRATQT